MPDATHPMHRPLRHALATMLSLAGLVAVAAPAAANTPVPVTRSNPVRIPSLGNAIDGTLRTQVSYGDTTATATASTADQIGLGRGEVYRLLTCVAYHLSGTTPVSTCSERSVDTRTSAGTVYADAPSVTLSGRPRPTTQPWGYFTAVIEVRNAASPTVLAHSWPDEGLQGAGIAVAPQDQDAGALPPNSVVTLDGPFTSVVNSGQPDSICNANPTVSDGSPLPAGVSTSHPAFTGAPGYYEVGLPSGRYEGQSPRGVMLVIHGGGWATTGAGSVERMRPDAQRWRNRGWQTVNFTYRPCGQSLDDALWFYDHARAWFDPSLQICALGTSAGGHLALLVGAYRIGLYCVVNQAGPTDLRSIQDELAYDTVSGLYDQTAGGRTVHNLAAAAFGEENLAQFSPAALASPTLDATRVLQALSADDPLVPFQQAADLAGAMQAANPAAYVDDVQLAIGTIPFAHGRVTQAALTDFYARERRLVAPLAAPALTPLDTP
jgi:acetyl esterase/lipase